LIDLSIERVEMTSFKVSMNVPSSSYTLYIKFRSKFGIIHCLYQNAQL